MNRVKKATRSTAAAVTVATALTGLLVHMTAIGTAPANRTAAAPPVHMTSVHRV